MKVIHAEYVEDFKLRIYFSNGHNRLRDMSYPFSRLSGYYSKWNSKRNFRKFKIDNGHLVWGKDWDVIYSTQSLYSGNFFGTEVVKATHVKNYKIKIVFSNKKVRIIDFEKKFIRYAPSKWLKMDNFMKFRIDEGNIVWGKNWDVIFKIESLLRW